MTKTGARAIAGALVVSALVIFQAAPYAALADESGVELAGTIESMPADGLVGDWVVNGTAVHVTDSTEIDQSDGLAAVGASVDVEGAQETDGSISADQIEVTASEGDDEFGDIEFTGTVTAMPSAGPVGDWTIDGTTVHVTDATEIDSEDCQEPGDDGSLQDGDGTCPIVTGDLVDVEGFGNADGSVTATQIQRADASESEDSITLSGTVDQVSLGAAGTGSLRVAHHRVAVSRTTHIVLHQALRPGASAKVSGVQLPSGKIRASRVIVR